MFASPAHASHTERGSLHLTTAICATCSQTSLWEQVVNALADESTLISADAGAKSTPWRFQIHSLVQVLQQLPFFCIKSRSCKATTLQQLCHSACSNRFNDCRVTGLVQTLGTQWLYYQGAANAASAMTQLAQYLGMAMIGYVTLQASQWSAGQTKYSKLHRMPISDAQDGYFEARDAGSSAIDSKNYFTRFFSYIQRKRNSWTSGSSSIPMQVCICVLANAQSTPITDLCDSTFRPLYINDLILTSDYIRARCRNRPFQATTRPITLTTRGSRA